MIRRRRTTESGGGVLSFTFLDVLTCTMGSLVLLLVVLAQRSTNVTLEEALKNAHKPRAAAGDPLPTGPNTTNVAAEAASSEPTPEEEAHQLTPEELAKNLAELREQMPRLEKLRLEAIERAKAEEARVSHLEDHERRLEHELAKLHVTLARLEESEKKQSVDQKTADLELERLRKLVDDTEAQVESMKKESTGKRSYAIVPYKGSNGTFRRPIYIECTKDAVTIYPEGIKLTAADFDGPLRSGNPLAAAIRAAREELNARAKAAGQTDLPDPYPLLIVRPDGAYAYGAATSAISSWDSDFGYEFVDADWKLEYPAYDPRLDQVMRHAVDQARQRQAMLAKAAPRRYGSRLAIGVGEGGDGGGGDGAGGGDFEGVAHPGGSGDRIGDHSGESWMQASGGNGNGGGAGTGGGGGRYADGGSGAGQSSAATGSSTGNFSEQQAGGLGGTPQSAGGQTSGAGAPGSAGQQPGGGGSTALAAGAQRGESGGQTNAAPSGNAAAGQSGGSPGGTNAQGSATPSDGPSSNSMAGGAAGGSAGGSQSGSSAAGGGGAASGGTSGGSGNSNGANNGGASGGMVQYTAGQTASAAQSRGANWANGAASRRASAITRPIRVIVQPSQIDIVPDADGGGATPTAITFHQSTEKVLDQLAATVQERIKDWGLAGAGMYWRPTLVLQISPGAEQHAIRLNDLLRDSGVDVRFEQVAARAEEGGQSGPR